MTEQNPTSVPATPLWQPSGVVSTPQQAPYVAPVASSEVGQSPYETSTHSQQAFLQPQSPYQQDSSQYWQAPQPNPYQQGFTPYGSAPEGSQPGNYAAYFPLPKKPSALPVDPKRYSQFLQTPRRRWWRLPIPLVVSFIVWCFAVAIVLIPAVIYEIFSRHLERSDSDTIVAGVTDALTNISPAFFLANNIGIALMIPAAWLGSRICGQRPRWLSSIVGGLRWGWLFRVLGLILVAYIVMDVLTYAFTGLPPLSWKPYSLFMIFVVLLTTPLQCAGEEYGLRGLVNRIFGSYGSRRVSFWIGGIASSLVFMKLHGADDIYLNIFYFSFGMLSCWMAWRTGGLEAGIALHVVNNVTAMAVLPFSDFSGLFDRGAGSASLIDVLPTGVLLLVSMGIVEWQSRRHNPVAVASPGAVEERNQIPVMPSQAATA